MGIKKMLSLFSFLAIFSQSIPFQLASQPESEQRYYEHFYYLDENWSPWEIRNWWFLPSKNLAIRKSFGVDTLTREGNFYYVFNLEFRALNGTTEIDPFNEFWLSAEGGLYNVPFLYSCLLPEAKEEWVKLRQGEYKGEEIYQELNNLEIEKPIDNYTLLEDRLIVGSSRNTTVRRKLAFIVARKTNVGYDCENNANIKFFIPRIKGVFYLGIGKDSVQLIARNWQPYKFLEKEKN